MYTYTTFVAAIADMLVQDPADPDFVTIIPSIITYAEERIYRELDLLATRVVDTSGVTTANDRNFTLPQANGRFVVIDSINIFTPAGSTATRNPLTQAALDYVNLAWPSDTAPAPDALPTVFAMVTDQDLVFAPSPGDVYTVEVIGEIRPEPLSASNTTTFLTLYLPDLFFAASMIFASAYQKNFGSQSDDPKMSQSWENQFNILLSSANVEEMRRKFASSGWTSKSPTPLAAVAR